MSFGRISYRLKLVDEAVDLFISGFNLALEEGLFVAGSNPCQPVA